MESRLSVRSVSAPDSSSSSMAPARARMVSVLFSARSMARPTSAMSSETPVTASEILVCASAAVYWALMVSLRVRKASTLAVSRCSASTSLSCSIWSWAFCSSRDWSWSWAAFLRSSATRARSSRPCASAWRACPSSFSTLCSSFAAWISRRFLLVATSATPRRTFCTISSCFS